MILDPCISVFCGKGRTCEISSQGQPACICIRHCKPHYKPVCGSDGLLYQNHCELHRAACIADTPIKIDHSRKCEWGQPQGEEYTAL